MTAKKHRGGAGRQPAPDPQRERKRLATHRQEEPMPRRNSPSSRPTRAQRRRAAAAAARHHRKAQRLKGRRSVNKPLAADRLKRDASSWAAAAERIDQALTDGSTGEAA